MFLKSIRLENVRCFRHLELPLAGEDGAVRQWTVLLGENGTGKSTVLRSIALVTSGSDALSELLQNPDAWIRKGVDRCRIEAALVTQEGEERHLALDLQRGDTRTDVIVRSQKSLEEINRALRHSLRNYFVVGYGAARRLGGTDTARGNRQAASSPRARSVQSLFDPNAELNPLEAWAIDLDYQKDEQGLQIVREVLTDFLPGVVFEGIDKRAGRLLFQTADGIVPLHDLSDGYQSVAAWVGDLLFRVAESFDDYREPLKALGLLIIDEVDLHLHPRWQRQLFSFLESRLPRLQLVVTTHSPMTAQQAVPGALHTLTRGVDGVEITAFRGDPRTLPVSQLMMTDAFAVDTDESVVVEQAKGRYRALRDRTELSVEEREELERTRGFLRDLPSTVPVGARLEQDQVELMRQIQRQLGDES